MNLWNWKPKRSKRKGIAVVFALIGLFALTLFISPEFGSRSSKLGSAAQAQSQNGVKIPESFESIKSRAIGYKGGMADQMKMGQIYLGKAHKSFYARKLFPSSERNAIEAYVWFTLIVAQGDHSVMLGKNAPQKETQEEFDSAIASDEERRLYQQREEKRSEQRNDLIKKAEGLRNGADYSKGGIFSSRKTLKSFRPENNKPGSWKAEEIFAEHYKCSPSPAAHYILGKFYYYGSDYVRQSDYSAYVAMKAAAMAGFGNAARLSDIYKGDLTLHQVSLATTEAERVFADAQTGCVGSSPYGGNYGGGSGGGVGSGTNGGGGAGGAGTWGPDYQTHRQNMNAGSNGRPGQPGVDPKNTATAAYEQGNSFLAVGQVQQAKSAYEAAISAAPTSRAALNASQQLQALTLTCSLKDDRIRRMVKPSNRQRVENIGWERIQLALKALGYYTEYVDGKPGPATRRAIRTFQRNDLNSDDTGYLSTDQRVELICAAAQDVRDPDAQIQLGIMYARGIGLNCNTAAAHAWFQKAADQGHPTALYNLGLMYLEGFYDRNAPGSYPDGKYDYYTKTNPPAPGEYKSQTETVRIRPRKIQDRDIAKYFFIEARDRGHPQAGKRIAEISSGKISKVIHDHSVIGCIDYDAEIDFEDIKKDANDLKVRLMPNGPSTSSDTGAIPQSWSCDDLNAFTIELDGLNGRADDYYGYVHEDDYRSEMGQNRNMNPDPDTKGSSLINSTRQLLDELGREIETQKQQQQCVKK